MFGNDMILQTCENQIKERMVSKEEVGMRIKIKLINHYPF